MGYELVGVEFDSKARVLRVYIDSATGILIEDCSRVSYQLSGALDVEDPIPGNYQLEVSSPGLDRPLFALADFERFKGHVVRVQLVSPINAQKRFKGTLMDVKDSLIVLQENNQIIEIPFEIIGKARLVPEAETTQKG
jgi:ribosome maturation factor RimP